MTRGACRRCWPRSQTPYAATPSTGWPIDGYCVLQATCSIGFTAFSAPGLNIYFCGGSPSIATNRNLPPP